MSEKASSGVMDADNIYWPGHHAHLASALRYWRMTEPIETVVVYHICQAGGHYGSHALYILFSFSYHTNCLKLNAGCPIEPQKVKLDLDLRQDQKLILLSTVIYNLKLQTSTSYMNMYVNLAYVFLRRFNIFP